MLNFAVLPSGSLEITCEADDKPELQEMLDGSWHRDHGFLAELLEFSGWSPNGRLYQVAPEDVAALTDAPILTDDLELTDDGRRLVQGDVWWYPGYQVKSFAEELIASGRTVFVKADPAAG